MRIERAPFGVKFSGYDRTALLIDARNNCVLQSTGYTWTELMRIACDCTDTLISNALMNEVHVSTRAYECNITRDM